MTPELTTPATDLGALAERIDEQHRLACLRAGEAVEHAKQAGRLLLDVKARLRHGEFVPWLTQNVAVSPRQAQRYMAAALGKPLPVRRISAPRLPEPHPNATSVSLLPSPPAGLTGATALLGCVHLPFGPVARQMFLVEPSTTDGFYFVSKLELLREHQSNAAESSEASVDWLRRPVARDAVGVVLQHLGAPAEIEWHAYPGGPATRPLLAVT